MGISPSYKMSRIFALIIWHTRIKLTISKRKELIMEFKQYNTTPEKECDHPSSGFIDIYTTRWLFNNESGCK